MVAQNKPDQPDRHLRRAMVLISCAALLFLVITVLQVITVRDEVGRASHRLAMQNLEASIHDIQHDTSLLVSDYTYWDEAFYNVGLELNPVWLNENYAADLENTFHVEDVFLVYPHGPILRVLGEATQPLEPSSPSNTTLIGNLRDLVGTRRIEDANRIGKPSAAAAFLSYEGAIYAAAGAEIYPSGNLTFYDRSTIPSVVFMRRLGPEWLQSLVDRLSLRHAALIGKTPTGADFTIHPLHDPMHNPVHGEEKPVPTQSIFPQREDLQKSSVVLRDPQGLELARLEFVAPDMAPDLLTPTTIAGLFASGVLIVLGAAIIRQMAGAARAAASQNDRLQYEISCRNAAEKELLRHQDQLEQKVSERNRALSREVDRTNALLHDLEQSLQRVQRIIDTSNEGFMHLDPAGRVISLNQKAQQILGYSPQELIGKTIDSLLTAQGSAIFSEQMRLRDSTQFRSYALEVRAKDGAILQLDVMASSEFHNGALSGSFAFFRDIREQLRQQQELKDARDIAQSANEAKSAFLARMCHELRTPLNAIMGFAQLLMTNRTTPLPPRQHEQATRIHQAGESLLYLLNEILDLSRAESGRITLKLEALAPMQVLQNSVHLASVLADQMNVTLHIQETFTDGSPMLDADLSIYADYNRLQQILLNLISNGIKYNHPGGKVTLSMMPVENRFCRFRVEDTGIGISEAYLSQIFQPFNRLAQEGSNIEGSGIGLSISKKIAEAMGGSLTPEPLEQGMAFTLDIPLALVGRPFFPGAIQPQRS